MGFAVNYGHQQQKMELAALLREAEKKAASMGLWFNGYPADNQFQRIAEYLENERHHSDDSTSLAACTGATEATVREVCN